jgi:methylmalonyl-CoA mutase N-terminal domain/subunit
MIETMKAWTMRQFARFGTPEATNERPGTGMADPRCSQGLENPIQAPIFRR